MFALAVRVGLEPTDLGDETGTATSAVLPGNMVITKINIQFRFQLSPKKYSFTMWGPRQSKRWVLKQCAPLAA